MTMVQFAYDLNPVQHLVADAVGEPGNRTFFLQGRAGSVLVNVVMEKQEVANLAVSVLQLLEDLEKKFPDLLPAQQIEQELDAETPFKPTFRASQLILGYDEEEDMIWVIAKAMVMDEAGDIADPDGDDVPAVRFVGTREQMRHMSEHALGVVSKGRPICPLCNRPIDREGHFCPRTDGEAMPVIF
jgi:uncharacterized repeat protein (TIGR03847 family)